MDDSQILTDALTTSAAQLLEFVRKTAENAEGFVVEQTPLFIQEYLNFNFYQSLLTAIILFIVCLGIIIGIFKCIKNIKNTNNDTPPEFSAITIIGLIILPIIFTVCSLHFYWSTIDAIKVKTAPRVYIVDTLLKKVK